jgi:hypothetical protein
MTIETSPSINEHVFTYVNNIIKSAKIKHSNELDIDEIEQDEEDDKYQYSKEDNSSNRKVRFLDEKSIIIKDEEPTSRKPSILKRNEDNNNTNNDVNKLDSKPVEPSKVGKVLKWYEDDDKQRISIDLPRSNSKSIDVIKEIENEIDVSEDEEDHDQINKHDLEKLQKLNEEHLKSKQFEPKKNFISKLCSCFDKKIKTPKSYYYELKDSKFGQLSFYKNNISFIIVVTLFFLLQIALIIIQLNIYYDANHALKTARCGGILLNFNLSIIMLFVMRRMISMVRNSFVGRFLPCDDFLFFHKFLGAWILIWSFIHTIGHCVNLYYLSDEYLKSINFDFDPDDDDDDDRKIKGSYGQLLFGTNSHFGWILELACPTGWLLLFFFTIMTVCSMPFVRRKGLFQVYLIFYILICEYLFVACSYDSILLNNSFIF